MKPMKTIKVGDVIGLTGRLTGRNELGFVRSIEVTENGAFDKSLICIITAYVPSSDIDISSAARNFKSTEKSNTKFVLESVVDAFSKRNIAALEIITESVYQNSDLSIKKAFATPIVNYVLRSDLDLSKRSLEQIKEVLLCTKWTKEKLRTDPEIINFIDEKILRKSHINK